jgi:hypothetical protein
VRKAPRRAITNPVIIGPPTQRSESSGWKMNAATIVPTTTASPPITSEQPRRNLGVGSSEAMVSSVPSA